VHTLNNAAVRERLTAAWNQHEVEGPVHRLHDLVRVAEPRVDVGRQAGLREIGDRLAVASRIDFDGDERAAGLAERPGDPDAARPR
jgi:hypothetical protein